MDPFGGLATLLGNVYTVLAIIAEFFGIVLGVGTYLVDTILPFFEGLFAPRVES
jgi:hypothetical protein